MLAVLVAHGAQRETGTGEDATKDDETCKHRKTVSVACRCKVGEREGLVPARSTGVHNAGNITGHLLREVVLSGTSKVVPGSVGLQIGQQ